MKKCLCMRCDTNLQEELSFFLAAKSGAEMRKNMNKSSVSTQENYFFNHSISLNEWFEIWMQEYKIDHIKLSSVQTYQTMYTKRIKDILGNCPLEQIRPFHLQKIYNSLLKQDLSSGYLHCIHAMLHNVFQIAVYNDLMVKNPCTGVILPAHYSQKPKVLTLEEQQALLQFLAQSRWNKYQPIIITMLGTGVRVGELLALNWSDIDFSNKTISINKSLAYIRDTKNNHYHFQITTPKTHNSYRTIPMSNIVEKNLKHQKCWLQQRKKHDQWQPIENFGDLVFPNKYGHPQQRGAVQRILNNIVNAMNNNDFDKSLKIQQMPSLHPHTLRHSFATRCFEVGIPAKTVQMLLGHNSVQLTLDIYTHVSERKKKIDMEKLNHIIDII